MTKALKFLQSLKAIYQGDDLLTDAVDLLAYSYDNSRLMHTPDYIVFPSDESQIQKTIKLCVLHKTPLVVRGRGTATTGAALAHQGGIVLSTERLTKIIKIDTESKYAVVQPGVTNAQLQKECEQHGLFWAPNPTSSEFCSIGGNLACNASGSRAVKYGSTRDNVWAMRFFDGTGRMIKTGKPVSKLSVGLDLTALMIGSEGMLGVVVEATLPLLPLPEISKTIRLLFSDNNNATNAVLTLTKMSNIPSAIEFLDSHACDLIKNEIVELQNYQNATMLLLNIDSDLENIDSDIAKIRALTKNNCLDFKVANTKTEAKDLWNARKILSPKLKQIAPKKINEDIVVPIAKIPELLNFLDELQRQKQIMIINFGHAGNGNIHVNLLIDPDNNAEVQQADEALKILFAKVGQLNGAISGEHGIGLVKKPFLSLELTDETCDLMRSIKLTFDPHNILNPDKGFSGH